jgi:hypothetical protein
MTIDQLIKVKRGKKYFQSAKVIHQCETCIVLEIELKLKWPDAMVLHYLTPKPRHTVSFISSERSTYNGLRCGSADGEIHLPKGWTPYMITAGMWTIHLTLIKDEQC